MAKREGDGNEMILMADARWLWGVRVTDLARRKMTKIAKDRGVSIGYALEEAIEVAYEGYEAEKGAIGDGKGNPCNT